MPTLIPGFLLLEHLHTIRSVSPCSHEIIINQLQSESIQIKGLVLRLLNDMIFH